ncbi:MAG: hypothetical protein RL222_1358 [Bacteroidota bacterium]|jgi:hypothetical protein
MKKVLFLFLLFIGAASMMTSCKKEEETEKQRVSNLLTKSKWFYTSKQTVGVDEEPYTCFDENDYFEFKTDGTFTETWDFGDGTYTVSEDGKVLTLAFTYDTDTYLVDIKSIDANTMKLIFDYGEGLVEYTYSKTASDGCPK